MHVYLGLLENSSRQYDAVIVNTVRKDPGGRQETRETDWEDMQRKQKQNHLCIKIKINSVVQI